MIREGWGCFSEDEGKALSITAKGLFLLWSTEDKSLNVDVPVSFALTYSPHELFLLGWREREGVKLEEGVWVVFASESEVVRTYRFDNCVLFLPVRLGAPHLMPSYYNK